MKDLREWEEFETRQQFRSRPDIILKKKVDVLKEMLEPCGRFGSAASWEERIDVRLSEKMSALDPYANSTYMITRGIPLNWQLLADYLRAQGLTSTKAFHMHPVANDLPRRPSVTLFGADLSSVSDGKKDLNLYGSAHAADFEESMSKAVGELLERYFLAVYRNTDLVEMSYADILASRKRALDIHSLNSFLPWQRQAFTGYTRDDMMPIKWVEGTHVQSGRKALIPAQLVFWSYMRSVSEPILGEPNTNGAAGHFSHDQALLSGILELIQRDGFLIFWLNQISPKVIDISGVEDESCRDLFAEIRRYDLEMYFLNTTTDVGIPSCACALIDRKGGEPTLALGGGCGFTERELLYQSASEALTVLAGYRNKRGVLTKQYRPFLDTAIGREQRLALWWGEHMLEKFSFFISGERETVASFLGSAKDMPDEQRLQHVLNRLWSLGYECYSHTIRHKVLKTLRYHVVRAIVPQLLPLYLNEASAALDSKRLREVPEKLGYRAAEEYNPLPHPFP